MSQRISELEGRVSTDALTGLWNRAHFDHVLEKELGRSLRHKQPVSLILFDIDHFKHINDEFGHQAGDEVLREIALIGSAVIRSSDALFRWGGDEFAVLAPSTGYRGAAHLAESLRREAASHRFPAVGSLTLSLGVAEHTASNESAESWFRRTDGMLYAAKGNGRNTVRVDARGSSDLWATGYGRSALHLVWQESYECGEPAVDSEHRELFRLANELIDAFFASEKRFDGVTHAYDRLLAHITLHFANEEALLTQHGFAQLDAHRRAHASLLARARDLRNTVVSGGTGLGGIIEFLAVKVVAHHILEVDRDFFPLFSDDACLPTN